MNTQQAIVLIQAAAASGGLNVVLLAWLILKAFGADRDRAELAQRIATIEAMLGSRHQHGRRNSYVTEQHYGDPTGFRDRQSW